MAEFSQDILDILHDEPPNSTGGAAASGADVHMAEAEEGEPTTNTQQTEQNEQNDSVLPYSNMRESGPRTAFATYLTTPIVTLIVGTAENETILTAHQGLLTRSPYFADACTAFTDDGSPRRVELPNDEVDPVGCFLEYLYTGDYFPKRLPGPDRVLEPDPSMPAVDESGDQLLRHARVYSIAEKFGMDELKKLASSKIHCVNSTAKGEIIYARYIYQYTNPEDLAMRGPVINFWATRSHTLRAEADDEFRSLCLEFPQFGYDVLTRVLDDKLKREKNLKMTPSAASGTGSARKRPRHSNV
ncbi:hypothetical protein GGS21DRAFT_498185 [Xylaria nigripes]|nr:hypothetical protein GGS21DRAFT_498185 [Xylaria nigripes]